MALCRVARTTREIYRNAVIVVKTRTTSVRVLKSQVGLLVGGFGFAAGAFALSALCWEHRPRGQMKISQRVRHHRIDEGLAATPAFQKPFRHRLKILRFSTKAYDREISVENLLSTRCQVAVIRLDLSIAFVLIVLWRREDDLDAQPDQRLPKHIWEFIGTYK
jgi:hypothetical protein